jgi:hypothetical protein
MQARSQASPRDLRYRVFKFKLIQAEHPIPKDCLKFWLLADAAFAFDFCFPQVHLEN